jgi:hypothetical protein
MASLTPLKKCIYSFLERTNNEFPFIEFKKGKDALERKMPNPSKMANASFHPQKIYHFFFKQHFRNNTMHQNVDW